MSDIAERLFNFNFNFFTIIVEGRQGLLTVLQGKGLKELKIVEGQAIENISNLAQDNKVTYVITFSGTGKFKDFLKEVRARCDVKQ